jgi:hypothetical protein
VFVTGFTSKIEVNNKISLINVKIKEWIKNYDDIEYEMKIRYLSNDERLAQKTKNLRERSHIFVCRELSLNNENEFIIDIFDLNYLPGYQEQKFINTTTIASSSSYNWDNNEKNYRRSISEIIESQKDEQNKKIEINKINDNDNIIEIEEEENYKEKKRNNNDKPSNNLRKKGKKVKRDE